MQDIWVGRGTLRSRRQHLVVIVGQLFAGILLYMIGMTTWVSLHKSILASGDEFSWAHSPWAGATLFDAYFAFITFYTWVFYKENHWLVRIVWFIAIMGLGNIAMSSYVLIQLFKLRPEQPASAVLLRNPA